jgi:catalase
MIPYIEPSPDPLFQARLFIYSDAQRYRLGVNNKQLPCNAPDKKLNRMSLMNKPLPKVADHQRAGAASFISQEDRPNYQSTDHSLSFNGPKNAIDSQIRNNMRHEMFDGTAYRDQLLPSDFADREIVVEL